MNERKMHLDTPLAKGLIRLLKQLENDIELDRNVHVYLAGGMAVNLYIPSRVTTDIDAEFSARIKIPDDLITSVLMEDGRELPLYIDTNYNSTFALMHEDYELDSIAIETDLKYLKLHVLSPIDLVVSKIARLAENDREDIKNIISSGLVSSAEIEKRATEAKSYFVGGHRMLQLNINEVVKIAKDIEPKKKLSTLFTEKEREETLEKKTNLSKDIEQ